METLELQSVQDTVQDTVQVDYYDRPELSHSKLKKINKSYNEFQKPFGDKTEPIVLGSCLHEAVLEPHIYKTRDEAEFKTIKSQGFQNEYNEKGLVIPQGKHNIIQTAKETVINHPAMINYLEGEYETEIFAEMYGKDCKSKLDILNLEKGYLNDLKSTSSIGGIKRYDWWVKDKLYHTQMAFYRAMVKAKYDVDVDCYLSVYGWAENDLIVLKLSDEILEEAETKIVEWIDKLNAVEVFGAYKGISDEIILV